MDHKIQCRQLACALPIYVQRPLFRHCSSASNLFEGPRVLVKELVVKVRGRIMTFPEVEVLVIAKYAIVAGMENEAQAMQVGIA